ncbi:MAG: UDP-N-acetylmuramoyl-L-alanine--D-glutamate ligase [Firmicutes bacterium]|nr:UDP-N-acetylmuramoyl-L-alanine--D-glutamate ligase [Bacillota bacterium]
MLLKGNKYLVVGLGKSGIAAAKVLIELGADVTVQDKKRSEELDRALVQYFTNHNVTCCFGKDPEPGVKYKAVIMSPGAPLTIPFVQEAQYNGAEIISEIELAYRLGKGTYVAITGTNGKTTTTTLTGEIFAEAGRKTKVVGNIGVAVVKEAIEATDDTWFVTEVSSFQLEPIRDFHPHISAILNLTPDHLDRHKTMEGYTAAKARVFENQGPDDYFVVNKDDAPTWALAETCKATVVPFSRKEELEFGAYVKDGVIAIKDREGTVHEICGAKELHIPGAHNLENALAAAAIAFCAGIGTDVIARVLRRFAGVEHRLELVSVVDGVKYINDSKGTNPDSSIKALEAMETPVLLIAGGYDKKSSYEEFIKAFDGKVKKLLLLGVTGPAIRQTALELGYPEDDILMCKDMDECVRQAAKLSCEGDTVLLSPACASWDMYDSYEQRGAHFKSCVRNL